MYHVQAPLKSMICKAAALLFHYNFANNFSVPSEPLARVQATQESLLRYCTRNSPVIQNFRKELYGWCAALARSGCTRCMPRSSRCSQLVEKKRNIFTRELWVEISLSLTMAEVDPPQTLREKLP
jgi:hypothetical protein